MSSDQKLLNSVLQIFHRAISTHYKRKAKKKNYYSPQVGSITAIQRFGGSVNLNIHFHSIYMDGVYVTDLTNNQKFIELIPTNDEIRKLRLALKDERKITVVLQNYRKDGTPFWNELTVSPVFNKKGELINFVGIQRDITEHLEAETARKKLELEIVRIADEERQLIALDLHDGLGSYLSGLALICKAHSRSLSLEGSSASHKADEICNLMGGAVTQLREVARGLYPIKETGIGLMDALNDLVARTSSDQVNCFFDCIAPVLLYDSTVANHLYHIAQEAVTNALKYSQADEIIINLSKVNKKVCLSITDNGIGVGTVELKESDGIGLRTIAYRVRLIEGELKIHNKTDTRGIEIICYCYLT